MPQPKKLVGALALGSVLTAGAVALGAVAGPPAGAATGTPLGYQAPAGDPDDRCEFDEDCLIEKAIATGLHAPPKVIRGPRGPAGPPGPVSCIDSAGRANDKWVSYVPSPGRLFIWRPPAPNVPAAWIQFTRTAGTPPRPIPANVVCSTIAFTGNTLHVTVLTRDPVTGTQRVLESECAVEPNSPANPFNPNGTLPNGEPRCTAFVELSPPTPQRLSSGRAR